MAGLKQSRLSTEQTRPLDLENPAPGEACLSVRLWKESDPAGSPVRSGDPAQSLILDLISASQGVLSQPDASLVSASFPGLAQAILAARRLQWATQGLAQCDPSTVLAAAILVHRADDLSDPAALKSAQSSFDHATPGQILVTANAAHVLKDIPSLPLQSLPDSDLLELVWRNPAVEPSRLLDEEAVEALIKRHGLETEAPPLPQEPVKPPPTTTTRVVRPSGAYPALAIWQQPEPAAPSATRGMNPRLLYAGGGGVVVLIAIVAFFAFSHNTPNSVPQPARPSAAAEQTSPGPQSNQPAAKVPKSKPSSLGTQPIPSTGQQKPPAQSQKDSGQNQADPAPSQTTEVQQPQQKEKPAGCTLDQPASDIPKLLAQADNNRAAGRYEDAVRQYNRVLACGENSRARSGLVITHLAMHH